MRQISIATGRAAVAIAALVGCAKEMPASARPDVGALMDAARVPGIAIAEIDDCTVSDIRYFGVADVETGAPIGPETLFEAASLTKTVFAVIVNQLADEGVIDLDLPLADKFDYPRITDKDAYAQLTPRLILQHRSGLPNWAADPTDPSTWGEISFTRPPDTAFGYSGEAFMLLQAYVEAVTGQSLDDLFEERLGVAMPTTSLSEPRPGAVRTFGHGGEGSKKDGVALRHVERAGAAFSANTTAADYANFLSIVCRGANMSEAAHEGMLRAASPTDNPDLAWALGWGVQSMDGQTLHFHWGDNGPFKAFAALDLSMGDGLVYFANGQNGLMLIEPLAEPIVGDVTPIADWLDYGRVGETVAAE